MNICLRIGNSYVNGLYRYNSKLPSELTSPLPPIQDLFFFGGGGGGGIYEEHSFTLY